MSIALFTLACLKGTGVSIYLFILFYFVDCSSQMVSIFMGLTSLVGKEQWTIKLSLDYGC